MSTAGIFSGYNGKIVCFHRLETKWRERESPLSKAAIAEGGIEPGTLNPPPTHISSLQSTVQQTQLTHLPHLPMQYSDNM